MMHVIVLVQQFMRHIPTNGFKRLSEKIVCFKRASVVINKLKIAPNIAQCSFIICSQEHLKRFRYTIIYGEKLFAA